MDYQTRWDGNYPMKSLTGLTYHTYHTIYISTHHKGVRREKKGRVGKQWSRVAGVA
jgi:hypothetical protein